MRILVLTFLMLGCTAVRAATGGPPTVTAVQAELTEDLHARLLKVGASVFARVTVDWQGTNCVLRRGAILEAHVSSVIPYSKAAKTSELDLAFTGAQCGQMKMDAFDLLLAAMAAPPQSSDLGILSEGLPVQTSGKYGLVNIDQNYIHTLQVQTEIRLFPVTPRMRMGTVEGIPGVKLSVGTGPDNSSVLTSTKRDVSLEKHSMLLLIPAQGNIPLALAKPAQPPSPSMSEVSGSISTPAPDPTPAVQPQPPDDDIEVCEPPQCNLALPSGDAIDEGKTAASISIRELGYSSRPQRMMKSFGNDEALAYLGPTELLVAFNPHILAPRHALGRSGSTVRVIRAAIVETQTHRVTHTVDWELPDNRQYLWPLTQSRVLVHVGSELRVYGEGLKIQNRIPLDGPLAFVRVTPDGSFLTVGVIHERHSPELHAKLTQGDEDPEEDVNIIVLNSNFETIAKSTTRSGLMVPTLLNEGQARLLALPNMRYRVSMLTWDNQTRTVARFNSSCTPEMSSIAPDLIFLVSCDKQTEGRYYRVLRSDGKLALKGGGMPNDVGHAAGGSANHEAFVVKVVQSRSPIYPGVSFNAMDFLSEKLGVYRATDGKRLLGVRVASPSTSRDGYALAPDGSQLAVLTRDQIAIYSVPRK